MTGGNCDKWKLRQVENESGFRPPLCTYRLNWASDRWKVLQVGIATGGSCDKWEL